MEEFKEALGALSGAARYSWAFCLRNSKRMTIARVAIAVMTTLVAFLTVQATGWLVNAMQASADLFRGKDVTRAEILGSGIGGPVALLVGLLLIGVVLGRYAWFCRSVWVELLKFGNYRELYNHRATLDVARFQSQRYDDLIRKIEELPHLWSTRIRFSEEMIALVATASSFLFFGSSLVWHAPAYALVIVLATVPMMVVEFRLTAVSWALFEKLVPILKVRNMLERPFRVKTVFVQALGFDQMPALRTEIDANVAEVVRTYDGYRAEAFKAEMRSSFCGTVGLCLVLVHAVWHAVAHAGEIGTLTVILAAMRAFQGNLEMMVGLVAEQWSSAKGVILIEEEYFGLSPVLTTENPVKPEFRGPPRIEFKNVSFAYPETDGKLVLRDMSLVIEPGSKVAIVGRSGAGKTTMQSLLMRERDPTEGRIFVDGVELRHIAPRDWNRCVSALWQEYAVLERQIGKEIASSRLGEPYDHDAVVAAARFADFESVALGKPQGFETQIGVEFGGCELSGGERQRLALARVRYRNKPIMILDEPDARLDPRSAEKVIDGVFALAGVTVIMITHHVSRAERCDRVIVVEKGEVVEVGKHNDLMERNGAYASMYALDKKRLGGVAGAA